MLSSLTNTYRFLRAHPMTSRRFGAALGRVLRWQIAVRLLPGAFVLPWVGDARLVARRGMTGATGNWYAGLMEYQDMGFILHFLRPGDLFLDVGANIGSFTVLASRVAGSEVISVEPGPQTRAALYDNIDANRVAERVTVEPRAVGAAPGRRHFTTGNDVVDKLVDRPGASTIELEIATIDAICASRTPICIKIDIEGGEHDALAGAQATLADPALQALIVELNDNVAAAGQSVEAITDLVRAHGFESLGYDPMRRALTTDEMPLTDNRIFVRDRAAVETRLREAPRIEVYGMTL